MVTMVVGMVANTSLIVTMHILLWRFYSTHCTIRSLTAQRRHPLINISALNTKNAAATLIQQKRKG